MDAWNRDRYTRDSRILDIADRILTLEDGHIQETDLAFDRVLSELNDSMALLAPLPCGVRLARSDFIAGERIPAPCHADEDEARGCDLPPPLDNVAGRAGRWSGIAVYIRVLEQSIRDKADQVSADVPDDYAGLRYNTRQSIEFLLETAAASFRSRSLQDVRVLVTLTGNRTEVQAAIRRGYPAADAHGDPQIRNGPSI